MPWQFEFTEAFRAELAALPHAWQKLQARAALEQIMSLDDPLTSGGAYLGAWAYTFGNKSLLLCALDKRKQIVIFTKVVV